MTGIALEYFAKALTVLAAEPGVDPSRLVVWGGSRGRDLNLRYPSAGHGVSSTTCYVRVTSTSGTTASGQGVELGATLQANTMAAADAPAKVLTFLRGL